MRLVFACNLDFRAVHGVIIIEDVRRDLTVIYSRLLQGDSWDSQGWELFIMQANVKDGTSWGAAGLYEIVLKRTALKQAWN